MSTFVFVNGQYQADLSRPDDLMPYVEVSANQFTLSLPENFRSNQPIRLQHMNKVSGSQTHQHAITLGQNSHAVIVESYESESNDHYSNTIETRIHLHENARLHYYKWQSEGDNAEHDSKLISTQARDSCLNTYHILTGAQSSNDRLSYALCGENASCESIGFYRTDRKQKIKIDSQIQHSNSHTNSRQLYKGMADDQSQAAFYGKIIVDPNIKDICAHQKNNNLLLSSLAEVDTKPELEIYSDDVQCTHGATVGQLDAEALFYLRSRGLVETEAKGLLIRAFVNEILDAFPHEGIASKIKGMTNKNIECI